jgi:hypothetical protein
MLQVMRDDKADKSRRDDMAKSAAPYVHPKFLSVTPTNPNGCADLSKLSDAELEQVERISRKLAASFGGDGGEGAEGGVHGRLLHEPPTLRHLKLPG